MLSVILLNADLLNVVVPLSFINTTKTIFAVALSSKLPTEKVGSIETRNEATIVNYKLNSFYQIGPDLR